MNSDKCLNIMFCAFLGVATLFFVVMGVCMVADVFFGFDL